jgi:hypothetical protein
MSVVMMCMSVTRMIHNEEKVIRAGAFPVSPMPTHITDKIA